MYTNSTPNIEGKKDSFNNISMIDEVNLSIKNNKPTYTKVPHMPAQTQTIDKHSVEERGDHILYYKSKPNQRQKTDHNAR